PDGLCPVRRLERRRLFPGRTRRSLRRDDEVETIPRLCGNRYAEGRNGKGRRLKQGLAVAFALALDAATAAGRRDEFMALRARDTLPISIGPIHVRFVADARVLPIVGAHVGRPTMGREDLEAGHLDPNIRRLDIEEDA